MGRYPSTPDSGIVWDFSPRKRVQRFLLDSGSRQGITLHPSPGPKVFRVTVGTRDSDDEYTFPDVRSTGVMVPMNRDKKCYDHGKEDRNRVCSGGVCPKGTEEQNSPGENTRHIERLIKGRTVNCSDH